MNDRENKKAPPVGAKVYSYEEDLAHWRNEYLGVRDYLKGMDPLKTSPRSAPDNPVGHERRTEPRYNFKDEALIFAHMGPKAFQIINIAIGGVAFFSDVLFEPGTKLLLSALGMIALDVEILSCDMEEVDSRMMECRYRVRAKFGPRVNGYQVYVLAREMYLQQGAAGAKPLEGLIKPERGAPR